jgi:hypothetical protein
MCLLPLGHSYRGPYFDASAMRWQSEDDRLVGPERTAYTGEDIIYSEEEEEGGGGGGGGGE